MPSMFDPPDPVKRARGQVFMKRFKPPEGVEEGFLGSFVGSMIEWRESGTKLSHEKFVSQAIDRVITPSPAPTPVSSRIQQRGDAVRRKLKSRAGRRSTILTESGLGIASTGKSVLLGGPR